MPDYQKGKIYKLWCPDNDLVYIGSTTQPLHIRLGGHKKRGNNCNSKLLFEASNNVKIELIEEFVCNNKMELNKREGEHIRANNCVNKIIVGRTNKEYYEDNKEYLKEKKKEWREDNKDKIKEYRENNKDKIKEQKKEYYEDNKDKLKEYYENNKDIINEKQRERYRLKKLQNIETN